MDQGAFPKATTDSDDALPSTRIEQFRIGARTIVISVSRRPSPSGTQYTMLGSTRLWVGWTTIANRWVGVWRERRAKLECER